MARRVPPRCLCDCLLATCKRLDLFYTAHARNVSQAALAARPPLFAFQPLTMGGGGGGGGSSGGGLRFRESYGFGGRAIGAAGGRTRDRAAARNDKDDGVVTTYRRFGEVRGEITNRERKSESRVKHSIVHVVAPPPPTSPVACTP